MTKFNLEMKFHQLSLLIISLIAITHCELNDNESKTSPTKKDEVVPADTKTTEDQNVIIPDEEQKPVIDNDNHRGHNGDEHHYGGHRAKHLHKKFNKIDTNRDGLLDRDEISDVMIKKNLNE